ncbi:manganese and iron superoxide dismutase [Aureobasidium pullulans EXF-150]|uniref:Superoxide dismutase n=1 Tax=Aureobasidium pullulans EXF-150 TaxID=1043002 RepID=A0A074XXB6_AURPU|nr:manganese and iron superoxide dismutase [Aureobasidium pullulans EXF-150]KEQ88284.1 manganese and iron superoxide dismutase [Aureobasidium pullulans EXF-150]
MAVTQYSLPPLPYAYDGILTNPHLFASPQALEPAISAQIMQLHHSKHHQTYITNLNAALTSQLHALISNNLPLQLANQQIITFNGGGHINHSLFWENLCAASESKVTDAKQVVAEIEKQWGGIEEFKDRFWENDPITIRLTPLLGVDMWEHAYYLQYLNVKAAYLENIWTVINWKTVEEKFKGGREDVLKFLRASI